MTCEAQLIELLTVTVAMNEPLLKLRYEVTFLLSQLNPSNYEHIVTF